MKRAEQTKLCPNCPLITLLPIISANRASYTRERKQLTPYKICQQLRTRWLKHPYITLEGCLHFKQTERIDSYAAPKNTR
ncbi:MAG: hypothetical protein RMJ15_09760 [Nitrososphaerota archaeon]|nr:hypothetical protein [Candidatus Bathyarchaeota archaeon]MDW8024000.1 hypothetical protein [Nitrososphaerota archaeon]